MKTLFVVLIAFVALSTASVPVEALVRADQQAGAGASCLIEQNQRPVDSGIPGNENHSHDADEGCPPCCDGCYLPCCTGMACLRVASFSIVVGEISLAPLARYRDRYSPADPQTIFHPPQI